MQDRLINMFCEEQKAYPVEALGQGAERILSLSQYGKVLLISHKGWYLSWEEGITLLCDSSFGLIPTGIGVPGFQDKFPFDPAWENVSVKNLDGELILPFCVLETFHAKRAPQTKSHYCSSQFSSFAAQAEALLRNAGKGYLYTLLPEADKMVAGTEDRQSSSTCSCLAFDAQSRIRIQNLLCALNEGNPGKISACTAKLLGLGKGLTPSADDWLLAFLYSLDRISERAEAEYLRQALKNSVHACTHPISASYLISAANQEYFERLENVLKFADPAHMEALLEIGSSSGADMLTGICFALKYVREKERNDRYA